MNCFHLRDWIKHDDTVPPGLKKDADKLVFKDSPSLQLCADLANGAKHLRRTKRMLASGKERTVLIRFLKLKRTDTDVPEDLITFNIDPAVGTHHDAIFLACDCWDAWHEFFNKHKLLP